MTKLRIAAVIQARMNSSRLPGKILMPLAGRPMLARLCERVLLSKRIDMLMIATTDQAKDDAVADLAETMDIAYVRGDETDVLARYVLAAEISGCDLIIRLTGDNPFVDGALLDYLLEQYLANDPPADYASNINETLFPYGLYAEIFPITTLRMAHEKGLSADDREHVTHYMRCHPEKFSTQNIAAPGSFLYDSLTIDTPEQYQDVSVLFEKHLVENPAFTFYDLLAPPKRHQA